MTEEKTVKIGEKIKGFSVAAKSRAEDIRAEVYTLKHDFSGATVVFIDRKDENMTLSIAFKTYPKNSTGVFHIIEHSVLCGSEKYPVKETISELAKGSLKTHMNAYTYPDKTVYPISSRNKQDFLNLASVYLDAVFCPLAVSDPTIFWQEGHRFDLDGEELSINGVVYNEMRGAYSSEREVAYAAMNELLFPGGIYSYDSGGNPDEIPKLTYEEFKEEYKKHYRPSNSYTVLDGSLPLEDTLSLLDGYFTRFGKESWYPTMPSTDEVNTEPKIIKTDKSEGEDKGKIYLGYRGVRFDNAEGALILTAAIDTLSGFAAAPLKKKILDTELCSGFELYHQTGDFCSSVVAAFEGVKPSFEGTLAAYFRDSVKEILENGIDRESFDASLRSFEFSARESDYGGYPKGMVYASAVYESLMFGGDPAAPLCFGELFNSARKKTDEEIMSVLRDVFKSSEAQVRIIPEPEFQEKREREYKQKLKELYNSFSDEKKESIKEENQRLKLRMETPDSEEALRSIPRLTLSDLDRKIRSIPTRRCEISGVRVLHHPIETAGIVYLRLFFDASDIERDKLWSLPLMARVFGNVATESGPAFEIRKKIKSRLGALSASVTPIRCASGEERLYFAVTVSALESEKGAIAEILREYLLTSCVSDTDAISKRILELEGSIDETVAEEGYALAASYIGSMFSASAAVNDELFGTSMLERVRLGAKNVKKCAKKLATSFKRYQGSIFTKERLTVSLTGCSDTDFLKDIIEIFPSGVLADKPSLSKREGENTGIITPAEVSYGVLCAPFQNPTPEDIGEFAVIERLLGYELLWNEVRIKGGAYDVSFSLLPSLGVIRAFSYRDPTPSASIDAFLSVPDMLRNYSRGEAMIDEFIICAVGERDALSTPSRDGLVATLRILMGKEESELLRTREAMLSFNKDKLLALADKIEKALKASRLAIVGSEGTVKADLRITKTKRI